MCQSLCHGGPDDEGIYTDEANNLVFGHRRLALIDLSPSGHQPMQYGNRYTITFNGEIYNYLELKEDLLGLGFTFQTASDTEVILAAFAAWGTASFAKLNGMFAFALFDAQTSDVYLVRDVVGIKPLYFKLSNDSLVFASEVRAFHHLSEKEEEHPYWPVFLMAYGHLPEPVTTLKRVKPLQKGSFLKYNLHSGEHKIEAYSFLSFFEKEESRADTLERVRTTLTAAVERHLLSDAPIGVFLSGGIDSSIIAMLAGDLVGNKLNTLSIYFQEGKYSEKRYQDMVLAKLETQHHEQKLTEEDFHFNLPEILEAMDQPSSDGINTWFISKKAADGGLKAVLSGLGGDELFGGYPSFKRMKMAAGLQKWPDAVLRSGRFSSSKRVRRLAYLSLEGVKGAYLFLRGQFIPASIAAHLDMEEGEVWEVLESEPVLSNISHLTPQNRASWMELNLYMQNQLLRDADVMSMAHGVEIRVPFLDKDFVRLALSIDSAVKYKGPLGKQLLIDAFRNTLPEEVWNRKKMGFSFPFTEWMRDDEWVKAKMRSGGRSSLKMQQKFETGQLHWSALMTTLLLRTNYHAAPPAFSYA